MDYVPYIIEKFKQLVAIDSPTGYTAEAGRFLMAELTGLGYAPVLTRKGGVVCDLGGRNAEDGLYLLAHVDTLGAIVSTVKDNGRLKLSPLGGLSPQNTEAENCRIHTRDGRCYTGAFQLENASIHVNGSYKTAERSFDTMEVVLDENTASKAETKALGIDNGDIVCFDPRTVVTESGYIKSRFLDDKLSAAILLGLAKYLKDENVIPARRLHLHMTVFEEIGHGASATVPDGITELLSVDMGCVGEGLDCTERMVSICVKDNQGPSNYEMTSKLIRLAKENGLAYAADVYPFYGADADAALRAGYDVRHGLVGAGVYASHGYERSHVDGVRNTFELVKAYALAE